jgi:L-cysteine:1D-myo-inositol 2-amino-2-deoxy-alpha-D-glucopyranoside ligase
MTRSTAAAPRSRLTLDGRVLPLVGPARIYLCGITPYDVTHLGHAATFVWADALGSVLRLAGVDVRTCRNVTDVDDVLTRAAAGRNRRPDEFAATGEFLFERDMAALRVARPAHTPRAHRYVEQVVRLAGALLERDRGYLHGGQVYFRAGAALAEQGPPPAAAEHGVLGPGDDGRESPYDVAVWRRSGPDEPGWPSPWGSGRPGWHAECAAIAVALLGASVDVQAGGADLAFPHHAYQSALVEAATGVTPFARAHFGVGTVGLDGARMAKSTGNLVLVSDLLERHPAAAVRLLLLDRDWRAHWDFREAALDGAAARLDRLYAAAGRGGDSGPAETEVVDALLSDVDVPRALAVAEESGGSAARLVLRTLALG